MTIIDEAGNRQTWIVKYWRHYNLWEHEADSLDEAFEFLSDGEGYGDLSSDSIIGPDGTTLYDQGNIHRALFKWERLRSMEEAHDDPRTPALPA